MCGIAGYIRLRDAEALPGHAAFLDFFARAACLPSMQRGPDAAGILPIMADGGTLLVPFTYDFRGAPFSELGLLKFLRWFVRQNGAEQRIGCSINFRGIPTTEQFGEAVLAPDQIQPFAVRNEWGAISVAHNGLLSNDKALAAEARWDRLSKSGAHDIDSYAFLQIAQETPDDPLGAVAAALMNGTLQGSWALAMVDHGGERLLLARSFLGLHLALIEWEDGARYLIWSSEPIDLERALGRNFSAIRAVDCWEMPSYSWRSIPYAAYRQKTAQWPLPQLGAAIRENTAHKPGRPNSIAVVLSGGLDSTVAATMACMEFEEVHFLHFQYGARAEVREWHAVGEITKELLSQFGSSRDRHGLEELPGVIANSAIIDLSYLKELGGSTLTDPAAGDVVTGEGGTHSAHEWVPARNTVMLAMAAAYCDRHKIGHIALGLNREEAAVYNDNSSEFVAAMERALDLGTQSRPKLWMPLVNMMKSHIYKKGREIGAPIQHSWSCYLGGEVHCGECGSCLLRKEAARMAGYEDNIRYAK